MVLHNILLLYLLSIFVMAQLLPILVLSLSTSPIKRPANIRTNKNICSNNNINHQHNKATKIYLQTDEYKEQTVVIIYNKPSNVITSHVSDDLIQQKKCNDNKPSRTTVYDDIMSMTGYVGTDDNSNSVVSSSNSHNKNQTFEQVTGIRSKLHAIGRLDADTTGLLLLTNDGGLVHHVTSSNAKSHEINKDNEGTGIPKTYEALIMGHHEEETSQALQQLWKGVDIGTKYGGITKPVDNLCVLDHPNHKSTLVELTISEGKNRQIRRMFHAVKSGVMKLKRTRIGTSLTLGKLKIGQWRLLSDDEIISGLGWEPRLIESKSLFVNFKRKSDKSCKYPTNTNNKKLGPSKSNQRIISNQPQKKSKRRRNNQK